MHFQQNKKFNGKCYNCGKMGHIAKDCWSKKKVGSREQCSNEYEEPK
ncbi:zinc finger domain-containing protein [Vibrio vulnificus]|nr:zinc finger domain-containing protein [Vibrio vulnificus]